jgi:putative flippase GtrA
LAAFIVGWVAACLLAQWRKAAAAGSIPRERAPRTISRHPPPPTVKFLRYSFVGAVGTAAHYALLVVLVQAGLAGPVLASTVGAVAGAIVNYLLNRSYTFASRRRHRESAPRFMAIAAAGTAINAALLATLVDGAGIHYLAAQVVATLAVLGFTYVANRAWTF